MVADSQNEPWVEENTSCFVYASVFPSELPQNTISYPLNKADRGIIWFS